LKMVWLDSLFGGKFPITVSLGIVGAVIGASIVLSLILPKKDEGEVEKAITTVNDQPVEILVRTPRRRWPMQKLLWKTLGIYLLLLGLALLVAIVFATY